MDDIAFHPGINHYTESMGKIFLLQNVVKLFQTTTQDKMLQEKITLPGKNFFSSPLTGS